MNSIRKSALGLWTFVVIALLGVFVDSSQGQLFRRQGVCPPGGCPPYILEQPIQPIIVQPIPIAPFVQPVEPAEVAASDWYQKLTLPRGFNASEQDIALVKSWTKRAVRILNGNSCGTGSLVGRDSERIYIMTNAHVASNRIGNVVRCEALLADNSGTEKFSARVIEAAYSSRTSTDWALLAAEPIYMAGIEPIKLSTEKPDTDRWAGTWGCPRCEVPSGQIVKTASVGGVWQWQPNSIGGQSGSAVVQDGLQVGLLTWTMSGNGAGQFTSTIYRQSVEHNTDGPARVDGLQIPSGYSVVNGVDLYEGYYAETGVGDYPIWAKEKPIVEPGPTPDPCPDMPDVEKRLRDRLRERGIDWVALLTLIWQIIELIQKSK